MSRPEAQDEVMLDTRLYAALRPRLLHESVPLSPDLAVPLLVREAEGGVPTGRWMVLDRSREPGREKSWGWPPVADNNSRNVAAARFPGKEAPDRAQS